MYVYTEHKGEVVINGYDSQVIPTWNNHIPTMVGVLYSTVVVRVNRYGDSKATSGLQGKVYYSLLGFFIREYSRL